jgi:hypothetical protein
MQRLDRAEPIPIRTWNLKEAVEFGFRVLRVAMKPDHQTATVPLDRWTMEIVPVNGYFHAFPM